MDASTRPDTYTADDIIGMAGTFAPDPEEGEAACASTTTHAQEPLPIVTKTAITLVNKGDRDMKKAQDFYRSAGLRFKEIKDRLPKEMPGVTWSDYCATHIKEFAQRTVDHHIQKAIEGQNALHSEEVASGAGPASGWGSAAEDEAMRQTIFRRWCEMFGRAPHGRSPEIWKWAGGMLMGGKMAISKMAAYRAWVEKMGVHRIQRDDDKWRAKFDAEVWNKAPGDACASDDTHAPEAEATKARRQEKEKERHRQRREKLAEKRVAAGGNAPKPRMDKETSAQYSRLAMMAKVMDAGQLQIVCDWIDEQWPGIEERAKKAKAERDTAPQYKAAA